MRVRAKFCVVQKTQYSNNNGQVVLQAVTGGSEENKSFWKYTPGGKVEMTIDNEAAFDAFEIGKEYYVDFTIANNENKES